MIHVFNGVFRELLKFELQSDEENDKFIKKLEVLSLIEDSAEDRGLKCHLTELKSYRGKGMFYRGKERSPETRKFTGIWPYRGKETIPEALPR